MIPQRVVTHLEHDATDVVYALRDGFGRAGDGDAPLCRVGKHFRGNLDGRAGHFSDFFDFGAAFADQRAALRGRHNQTQRDRLLSRHPHTRTNALVFLELVNQEIIKVQQ